MDMQPIEPSRHLSVTLTAEQWNMVLALCNEGPHRVVRPILDSLMAQLQRQSQQGQQTMDADNA